MSDSANTAGEEAMKLFIGLALMTWVILGFAGAWMLEGSQLHLRSVAWGPITLMQGMHSAPEYRPRG
jgi:hypothetical protein